MASLGLNELNQRILQETSYQIKSLGEKYWRIYKRRVYPIALFKGH